jgi:hypothetical protein
MIQAALQSLPHPFYGMPCFLVSDDSPYEKSEDRGFIAFPVFGALIIIISDLKDKKNCRASDNFISL